jgi:ketosteroid isomerase-like protein
MIVGVTDPEQVLARSAAWQSAIESRDVEGVRDYLHEDFALVLVVPVPLTMSREEWLRVLPDYVVHGYEVHQQIGHACLDTAAVLTLATQHATVLGQDRSGRFVLSDVWRREQRGPWRVWRRHSTPASAVEMPGA